MSTLAGGGAAAFADGQGSAASFAGPMGITVAASGVAYVADRDNHRVRAVTPGGVVSTFAGSGAGVSADGAGTGASFESPQDVKLDPAGTLFVVDACCIRSVPAAPALTSVFVGSASACTSWPTPDNNGLGTAALFGYPYGFAFNATGGGMLVADTFNVRTRWVSPAGLTTDGITAGLNYPCGIAADAHGSYYVSDKDNGRIVRVLPSAAWAPLAGSGASALVDGVGAGASFSQPYSLTVDARGETVFVADTGNHAIRQLVVATGAVSTIAGGGGAAFADGYGTSSAFHMPTYLALEPSGALLVSDSSNNAVRRVQCAPCPARFYCASGAPVLCTAGSFCPLSTLTPLSTAGPTQAPRPGA